MRYNAAALLLRKDTMSSPSSMNTSNNNNSSQQMHQYHHGDHPLSQSESSHNIHHHSAIHPRGSLATPRYESTADGDIVIVQPSFDDSLGRSSSSSGKHYQHQQHYNIHNNNEWLMQPKTEMYADHGIERVLNDDGFLSPDSRQFYTSNVSTNHHRNLSAHFFDATTLTDTTIKEEVDGVLLQGESEDYLDSGRKHRRMFSNEISNPSYAHRRINSVGQLKAVSRQPHRKHRHSRENSEGLDILSAAVDVSGAVDAVAPVVANNDVLASERVAPWDPPASQGTNNPIETKPSVHPESLMQYHKQHIVEPPTNVAALSTTMHPPALPYRRFPYPHQAYPPMPAAPHYYAPPQGPYYAPTLHGTYPPRMGPPQNTYPVQYSQQQAEPTSNYRPYRERAGSGGNSSSDENSNHERKHLHTRPALPVSTDERALTPTATNQGSQTFVTTIAVDPGNTRLEAARLVKTAATSTDDLPQTGQVPLLVRPQHHRKMSSFSSFGASGIFNSSSVMPFDMSESVLEMKRPGHHRASSSSISFLQNLDDGFDCPDANFLRDLHAANNAPILENTQPLSTSENPNFHSPTNDRSSNSTASNERSKLAPGGTSKRVRRKCTVENCPNRVVQGGLCISHGAKRKTCNHPGCTKNVKKAGMCSTHGPARKRCEYEGCVKVAVQGGRCIAHGAKKKMCSSEGCSKQAILAGMCKKHHDQQVSSGHLLPNDALYCQDTTRSSSDSEASAPSRASNKPTHTRGLSIFQEISADAVQSLLNEE